MARLIEKLRLGVAFVGVALAVTLTGTAAAEDQGGEVAPKRRRKGGRGAP